MGAKSTIEWTEATWNPATGCTKISPGCKFCYAERFAERFRGVPRHPYEQGFDLKLWPQRLEIPFRWKKPRLIFVNSMSDLFHEQIPESFISDAFDVMNATPHHTYQVLTKRSERLVNLSEGLIWDKNIWMGVSVENEDYRFRIDHLRQTPGHIKFLYLEPLLGPLPSLNLKGIDRVIVGGESGPGARPMDPDWARDIIQQCQDARVRFFLKQLGGWPDKRSGDKATLDGRLWREMP